MKNSYFMGCLLLAAAVVPTMQAEVTYTCKAGKNFGQGEGIDKMFDGRLDTKYCGNSGDDCWALVEASEAVYVRAYETTTANDSKESGGRCPRHWALYGTNDPDVAKDASSTGWVTLSDLDNNPGNADLIPKDRNFYTQRFYCDRGTVGTAYKYFKVHLIAGDTPLQLSEFKILGETKEIVTYDWVKELSADGSDKAVDWSLKQKWEGNNLAGKSLVIKASDDQPHYVIKYSFTTHDDNAWTDRAPKTWKLEGSNDLNEWQTIDEVTDGKIANERVKTFDFIPSNPEFACKYLRLTLVAMKGTGYQQVNEFHVIAAEAGHEHVWEETEKKEPTCVEPGSDIRTCKTCGAQIIKHDLPATGVHKYTESHGHGHNHCSMCGRPDPDYMSANGGFYEPKTADQFIWLGEMLQYNEPVNAICLTQDVDLAGFTGFGNGEYAVPFKGEFDGRGHRLRNLKIETSEKNTGLFGRVEDANIHDLGIEGAEVKSDRPNVGIVAGNAKNSTINRVAVIGGSKANGYDHVGAIVGNTEGSTTVSNCLSDATVHSTNYQAGGLIGTTNGLTLEKCLFTGKVLNDVMNVGGLVALLDSENSPTEIRNNISAATLLKANAGALKPIIITANRKATYKNNRVAASQLYQEGEKEAETKVWTLPDDEHGLTTADRDMKCLSFYSNTMEWDMENDWKFVEAGQYPVLAWMEGEAGSQTVSVPEYLFATVVTEAEVTIPEGVDVYIVKVNENSAPAAAANRAPIHDANLELVALTGVIPANTPVLIRAKEGEYKFNHHVEYGSEVGENHLAVAGDNETADGTHFTIGLNGKNVGFSRVQAGETLPVGSVYLRVPNATTKDFYPLFDLTDTGVESVAADSDESEIIYNLAGQRLNGKQKGIIIVNGKKVLNK